MTAEELRRALDAWANANPRPSIRTLPPKCSCEYAASPQHSPGPVADDEKLVYFVTSTYSVNLKRKKRNIRPNTLKNVFDKGLSVIRINHCNNDELKYSSKQIAEHFKNKEPYYGGIVSVIIVFCGSIRHEAKRRFFCVYETPCEPIEGGGFLRPSHADIVSSEDVDGDERVARMGLLHNLLILQGEHCSVFEFANGAISGDAPEVCAEKRGD